MRKKIRMAISLILVLSMLFVMAGCGDKKDNKDNKETPAATEKAGDKEPTKAAEPTKSGDAEPTKPADAEPMSPPIMVTVVLPLLRK